MQGRNKWDFLTVNNAISGISLIVAVISLCGSLYATSLSNELSTKYNRLSAYSSPLTYTVDIDNNSGGFTFDNTKISGGRISIVPKIGGISKVHAVHYQKGNVKAILPIDLSNSNALDDNDPQNLIYAVSDYTIDNIASSNEFYFGTLYIVTQDYLNNHYTNMIIYKVEKANPLEFECTVYEEIDLLNCYNEDIQPLPDFDFKQMQEYKKLVEKIDQLL